MVENPNKVSPRIEDIEPVTMECRYELPWERQSNQTACGTTIQYNNGDLNWRVVIEGIITVNQLGRLNEIRGNDSITVFTLEWGEIEIQPDSLVVTRSDDPDVGNINGKTQPWLSFQLQTKMDDEDPAVTFLDES